MPFTIYDAAVPPMIRGLENLSKMLEKAVAQATSEMRDLSTLLKARLAPDMLPLSRQVNLAVDAARECVSQLTANEPPGPPNQETTFPELRRDIAKVVDYLRASRPEQFDGAESRTVTLQLPHGPASVSGRDFLAVCIANFYYHMTVAFATLRQSGITLGKLDCVGQPPS